MIEPTQLARRLGALAAAQGFAPAPEAWERLAGYANLLLEWGQRINLTGAREPERIQDELLADALPLAAHLRSGPRPCCVDVGTGAGLPGLALACLRPGARWTLLEPNGKKHAFLAHCIRTLALPEVCARRERLAAHLETHAAAYDLAVSRAVWPPAEWLARAGRLLRAGGQAWALAGADEEAGLPPGTRRIEYQIGTRRRALLVVTRA